MRGPWRAALALALHIGFFAVPIALVLGLLAVGAYTIRYDLGSGLRALLAAGLVAGVLGIGMRAVLGTPVPSRGVPLGKSEQPQLWKMVEAISSAAGSRAPDEIRIVSEPRAGVHEDTALLGFRTRARSVELGLPLLAGMTVSELRAVVARESARTGGPDKQTATARRISVAVERAAGQLTGGPTKWLFLHYARLYQAVAEPLAADLDRKADAVSVDLAGKRAAVTAVRKSVAIELGWQDYRDEYLSMAVDAEHTPDVLLGFRSFMDQPERKRRLADRAKQAIADESDDGQVTTRERIAGMKRMSDSEREQDERPGFALLRNPRKAVPELEDRLLADGLGPRMPWPELAKVAGQVRAERQAGRLATAVERSGLESSPAIGSVLGVIHREQGKDLVNPVLDPGLEHDRVADAAIDTLTELLGGAVVDALICAGRAQHVLDWDGPPAVRLASGQPLDPDRLVRPAVADPRHVPGLHRALVDLGAPLQHARPPAPEEAPKLSGIVGPVQCASGKFELLVTDRGLLLVPSRSTAGKRLLAGVSARVRRSELEQLARLETADIDELRERSDSQWLDNIDVAEARLVQGAASWSLMFDFYLDDQSVSTVDPASVTRDGDDLARLEVSSMPDCEERGMPYQGLGELMGARMRIDDQRVPTEE
ncbi:M48 family metallopeptidase [Parasphingorhabdus pacifica]